MRLMLALKRKRQVDGKDTRFQYNGHEIDEERIERACKRHKGLLNAPTGAQSQCLTHVQCNNVLVEVPAYITALTPPSQSPRVAEQNAAFDHGIFSFLIISSAFFGPTLDSKDPALMTDIARGVDPGSVQAFDMMDATTMIDATGLPSANVTQALPRNTDLPSSAPRAMYMADEFQHEDMFFDFSPLETVRNHSVCGSDFDWQDYLNLPQSPGSLTFAFAIDSRQYRETQDRVASTALILPHRHYITGAQARLPIGLKWYQSFLGSDQVLAGLGSSSFWLGIIAFDFTENEMEPSNI